MKNRCLGSGRIVSLAWPPEGDYAGGVICPKCSSGLGVVEQSVRPHEYYYIGKVPEHRKLLP